MKYDFNMNRIEKILDFYKTQVDKIVEETNTEKSKIKSQINIYQQSYVDEGLKRCDEVAKSKVDSLRNKFLPIIGHCFDNLSKEMDNFFKGDITPEISTKATTFKSLDLKLNQREFDALVKSAKSYYDMRILGQMAESMNLNFDFNNGVMSDIETAYNRLNDFKGSATTSIKYYSGQNNELKNIMPPDANGNPCEVWLCASANTFMNERESMKQFDGVMKRTYSVLPERKIKRTLTEDDKKLIDALIDPQYNFVAQKQVKTICKHSTELAELLELDERYNSIVQDYYNEEYSRENAEETA